MAKKKENNKNYTVRISSDGELIDLDKLEAWCAHMNAKVDDFIKSESEAAAEHRSKDLERLADGKRHMEVVERFLSAIEKALSK